MDAFYLALGTLGSLIVVFSGLYQLFAKKQGVGLYVAITGGVIGIVLASLAAYELYHNPEATYRVASWIIISIYGLVFLVTSAFVTWLFIGYRNGL